MAKKSNKKTVGLIIILVLVILGGILFVGTVSGWFDNNEIILDDEYYCEDKCEEAVFLELSTEEYEKLIKEKKSFIIFVDQNTCTTADRLRKYLLDYTKKKGIIIYHMMFEDVRESSLHDFVKYYPSVVMINRGRVIGFLRADSDDDAAAYNNFEDFEMWMEKFLQK